MIKVIVTFTGPSGGGKSTLEDALIKAKVGKRILGFTTREPRKNEVDGVDVNFISRERATELLDSPELMQHVYFNGNYYGKTYQDLDDAMSFNGVGFAVLEPSGIQPFVDYAAERDDVVCLHYFVSAPTPLLVERLLNRVATDEDPNLPYYAKRVMNLLSDELNWHTRHNFRRTLYGESEADLRENAQLIANDIQQIRCAYA